MSWLIASQIVHDNATGQRFEFDASDPNTCTLRLFNKERTRVLVLMFQRDGRLLKSDVRGVRDGQLEDVGQAAFAELHQDPAVADAAARAAADLTAHHTEGLERAAFETLNTGTDTSFTRAAHLPGGVPGDPNAYAGEPTAHLSGVVSVNNMLDNLPTTAADDGSDNGPKPGDPNLPKQQGVFYGDA